MARLRHRPLLEGRRRFRHEVDVTDQGNIFLRVRDAPELAIVGEEVQRGFGEQRAEFFIQFEGHNRAIGDKLANAVMSSDQNVRAFACWTRHEQLIARVAQAHHLHFERNPQIGFDLFCQRFKQGGTFIICPDQKCIIVLRQHALDRATEVVGAPRASQGREDDRDTLHAGYRTVEGGANVEETYNFAWLHYAVVSGRWRL